MEMELKSATAKYYLSAEIILKSDIVKDAELLNLDIDEVLDNYITNTDNTDMIHELVGEAIGSSVNIESIVFDEEETLIEDYGSDTLRISCDCVVEVEELFSEKTDNLYIEEYFEDIDFWSDEKNISISDCRLKDVIV
ncbi:MAG: hypothetical protein IJ086_05720 [Clostridium sp.]|nr:hypothetical protein [Clostridium sp.]